jgi:hypothetical protein
MVGWRQSQSAEKNLSEEFFREGSPQCRTCAREEKKRADAQVVRIAPGVIAQPRERWAQDLIARLQTPG